MNASFIAQLQLKCLSNIQLLLISCRANDRRNQAMTLKFMHERELAQGRNYKRTAKKQIHSIFFWLQFLPLLQLLNLGVLHCHFSISFSLPLMATSAFHCFYHQFSKDNLPATATEPTGNKWHIGVHQER